MEWWTIRLECDFVPIRKPGPPGWVNRRALTRPASREDQRVIFAIPWNERKRATSYWQLGYCIWMFCLKQVYLGVAFTWGQVVKMTDEHVHVFAWHHQFRTIPSEYGLKRLRNTFGLRSGNFAVVLGWRWKGRFVLSRTSPAPVDPSILYVFARFWMAMNVYQSWIFCTDAFTQYVQIFVERNKSWTSFKEVRRV